MSALYDRVVVVTGAGRGLGREHALLAGAEGARVVVNDLGTDAGILRDRMFVNMSEDDWDAVIRGQLRVTFAPTRVFAEYWRNESKARRQPAAAVVNVPSTSGLIGAVGQTNYGAAKAGIAALTVILAQELHRYGVRVNAVTPVARTRMTQDLPGIGDMVAAPAEPQAFDVYHPGNVSPLVAWLLTADCPANGAVYYTKGGEIRQFVGWSYGWSVDRDTRWTVADIDKELRARA